MSYVSSWMRLVVVFLPVMIAIWLGVLGLKKGGKTGNWWCMFVGMILSTLAAIAVVLLPVVAALGGMHAPEHLLPILAAIAVLSLWGGVILFSIGFAIHGCRGQRLAERVTELELMNLAQATELERLRNR